MTSTEADSGTAEPQSASTAELQAGLPADLQDERLIASRGIGGTVSAFTARLRGGDLGSLPVVVGLIIIWGVFQSLNSSFLSSRNLVNLTLQSAAVGTVAIGIVLVLLLGEIDLSVGSVSGLASAVLAVTLVNLHWPLVVAVLAAIGAGVVIGLLYGALYNRFGVPSFVITLAGLLGILGVQLYVLGTEGTVNIPFDSWVVTFAQQSFLPPAVAYLLVALTVAAFVLSRLRTRAARAAAGLSTTPTGMLAARAAFLAIVLAVPVAFLNRDRGVAVMFVFFLALVIVMDLAIRRTSWGRSVMAVGGNVEAARASTSRPSTCRCSPCARPSRPWAASWRPGGWPRSTRAAAAPTRTSPPSPPRSSGAPACSAAAARRTRRCSASSSSSRSPAG